ncbi:hypothetical protein [Sphingobium aromaticiconvertens]
MKDASLNAGTLTSLPDRLFERRLGTASLAFLDSLVRMEREKWID